MSGRRKVRTFAGSLKRYDVSSSCTLPEFLKQIDDIVQSIPPEQRDGIIVDWTDGDDCDSGYIEFEHYRDETDAEMAQRIANEEAQKYAEAQHRERLERAAYERLKQKFG